MREPGLACPAPYSTSSACALEKRGVVDRLALALTRGSPDPSGADGVASALGTDWLQAPLAGDAQAIGNEMRVGGRALEVFDGHVVFVLVTMLATAMAGDHDSYAYFARRYGMTVIGAVQPSDFSEPSPRDVAELIDQIREEDVPAVFGSEVFPSDVLEQIADETGAVYVDQLRDDDPPGEPGDPEHTYVGMMLRNMELMIPALGGNIDALAGIAAVRYVRAVGIATASRTVNANAG